MQGKSCEAAEACRSQMTYPGTSWVGTRDLVELRPGLTPKLPKAFHAIVWPLTAELQQELGLVWQYLKWPPDGCVAQKGLYSSLCLCVFLFSKIFFCVNLYLPLSSFLSLQSFLLLPFSFLLLTFIMQLRYFTYFFYKRVLDPPLLISSLTAYIRIH